MFPELIRILEWIRGRRDPSHHLVQSFHTTVQKTEGQTGVCPRPYSNLTENLGKNPVLLRPRALSTVSSTFVLNSYKIIS